MADNLYLQLSKGMEDYNELTANSLHYFKDEARKAFAPICSSFGLHEEDVTLTDTDNLFQVTFSNSKIRIVVTGINWGMNTDISFGVNTMDSYLYSIEQLIKARKPEIPIAGSQVEQLFGYSHYLMTYAPDILQGEPSFFNQQEALMRQEKENARIAMEAEATRKISEGYLKIDTLFGEPVWRKPRPLLSPYGTIKDKFPNSIDVVFEDDLLCFEQYEAVVTNWKIELDEIVIKDEVICEISTDKVLVEIVAPQTGRLIWLLEEGIVFKFPGPIALLD
ncbi:biotin/lipoyl-containing protein [Pedobacter cryoconitis]|uniref:Lipoyl-binding domain-containing protein n=1 Tax=Pedobacter cryoconitis TaxID=188932 RepID=A0A7X0J959_9SPHI|nr:lipoyl domain-containing protein [Pedobacter cryoconitis]MBB6502031.1 hypothetical protein [Pedobacter cryoconitis]